MRNFLKRFQKNENGVVAIIVALSLAAILFGVLALSIDLNRTQESHGKNYNATDAAALAGAEMWLNAKIDAIGKKTDPLKFRPSAPDMENYVKSIIIKNLAQDQSSSTFASDSSFKVTMNEGRKGIDKTQYSVKVEACSALDTAIAEAAEHRKVARDGKQRVCTVSTAAFELGKLANTEVAFALDFTDSMYWKGEAQSCPVGNTSCPKFAETKAAALQNAMSYIIDTYFSSPAADASAFASIVPYSGFVNLYPYADNGVVDQATSQIDFDGKKFTTEGYSSTTRTWPDANNAINQYGPKGMRLSESQEFYSHAQASNPGRFTPFYTFKPYDGQKQFETENYSYALARVPVIDSASTLNRIITSTNKTSFLPLQNYQSLVNDISNEIIVFDRDKSTLTTSKPYDPYKDSPPEIAKDQGKPFISTDVNEDWAKMVCYQYTVAATLDERIDRDRVVKSSGYIAGQAVHGNRGSELHESFPIQPLTSNADVLKNILERYIATTKLITGNVVADSDAMNLQDNRLNKARILTFAHKTSSIHGLVWAWLSLRADLQNIWDENSLYENYVTNGLDKQVRDGSTGTPKLPAVENFKNIILISDGNDNDGLEEKNAFGGLGRYNSCDAYTPIAPVSDDQYDKLCTAIKANSTDADPTDDINIYTVMLDYDAGAGNRFEKCASPNGYFNNVSPSNLRTRLDQIFAGILTNAVPVKLIQ